MSEIIKHWNANKCRIEDGIYFVDDTYVPIINQSAQLPIRSIADLLAADPIGWGSVYPGEPLAVSEAFKLYGGETSWEGCGFLALTRSVDNCLLWLLHSSDSEAFVSADFVGNTIVAASCAYPSGTRWHFPVATPWQFQVEPVG